MHYSHPWHIIYTKKWAEPLHSPPTVAEDAEGPIAVLHHLFHARKRVRVDIRGRKVGSQLVDRLGEGEGGVEIQECSNGVDIPGNDKERSKRKRNIRIETRMWQGKQR